MDGSSKSTLTGNDIDCSSLTQNQHGSIVSPNQSVINQLSVLPDEAGGKDRVLADTLSQILNAPMPLGPSIKYLDDPTKLIQPTTNADSSQLTLGSSSTFNVNPPSTTTLSSPVLDQKIEERECTSAGSVPGMNIDQVASSIINSASLDVSVGPSTVETYSGKSGPLGGEDSFPIGTENIMDQISPPMVLPDLHVAMAEGMAVDKAADEDGNNDGGIKQSIAIASGIQSTVSDVEQHIADTSCPGSRHSAQPQQDITTHTTSNSGVTSVVQSGHEKNTSSVRLPSFQPSALNLPKNGPIISKTKNGPIISKTQQGGSGNAITQTATTKTVSANSVALQGNLPRSTSVTYPSPSISATTALPLLPAVTMSAPKLTSTVSSINSQASASTTSRFPPPFSVTPLGCPSTASSSSSSLTSITPLASGTTTSTSQSVNTSTTAAMLAKGLNLPLLQFLHLNFPSLKIKDLQDVLSINSLLTQVLKHQINPTSTVNAQQPSTEAAAKVHQSTSNLGAVLTTSTSNRLKSAETNVSSARFMLPKPTLLSSVTSAAVGTSTRSAVQSGLFVPSRTVSTTAKTSSALLSSPSASIAGLSDGKGITTGLLKADRKPVGHSTAQLDAGSLGINVELLTKQSSSLLSTLGSASPVPVPSSSSSRKAVLVQILNKTTSSDKSVTTSVTTTPPSRNPIMIPRMKPLSKSPLILNRHNRLLNPIARSTLPLSTSTSTTTTAGQATTPVSSLCVSLSLPAFRSSPQEPQKRKTPSRKSAHSTSQILNMDSNQLLSRTVVQPADSEAMEVDVGQPVQKQELPKHLKDHSYSLYNPEEGEKQRLNSENLSFLCSIPPARLSYAPQVPDSPSTLHKLLKVLPKKNSRQSPPRGRARPNKGKGIKKVGNRSGKAAREKVKKSELIPNLEALSDDGSSTDQSDLEESSRKVGYACITIIWYMCTVT